MNIYKVLTFDGYSSKEWTVTGYDILQAIQNAGMIVTSQIIKIELIGSTDQQSNVVEDSSSSAVRGDRFGG